MLTIPVVCLPHGEGLPLPIAQSTCAAGLDLHAAIGSDETIALPPGGRALVPTGIALALPQGFEAQVRPRSGLALKHGVTVLNSPGTIDPDYRGEVSVILINLGAEVFDIKRGARIAQLVVAPFVNVKLTSVPALPETARGTDGFGSSGVHTKKT